MNTLSGYSAPPAAIPVASTALGARLAHDLLGPVMLRYLMLLDAHVRYAARSGARILFVSRAGVRIRRLHGHYLAARSLRAPDDCDWLWASRCLAAKAAWNTAPESSLAVFHDEFRDLSVLEACRALRAAGIDAATRGEGDAALRRPGRDLGEFLATAHPEACRVVDHLREQSELFADYLESLRGPSGRFVLVDSGWRGTTQRLLARGFPQYAWAGLYFGRMPLPSPGAAGPLDATALVFESARFDPAMPASAFVLYRHLIEGLLQPHGRSIEQLRRPDGDGHWAPDAAALLGETPSAPADTLFCAVQDYIGTAAGAQSLAQIDAAGLRAMDELARLLACPTRAQAQALGGLVSSVDFGRGLLVPVLIDGDAGAGAGTAADAARAERIAQSLWPQGQLAIEYPADGLHTRQRRRIGLASSPAPLLRPLRRPSVPPLLQDSAAVVVLVGASSARTSLLRALASIGAQTFDDYLCVVIAQDEDPGLVLDVCEQAPIDPRRLIVAGSEPAAVRSRYVAVHDEHGSWHADFLRQTVRLLDAEGVSGRQCVATGVVEAEGPDVARSAVLVPAIACLLRREACPAVFAAGVPSGRLPPRAFRLRSLRAVGMQRIRAALAMCHTPAQAADEAGPTMVRPPAALYPDYLENHFYPSMAGIL